MQASHNVLLVISFLSGHIVQFACTFNVSFSIWSAALIKPGRRSFEQAKVSKPELDDEKEHWNDQ